MAEPSKELGSVEPTDYLAARDMLGKAGEGVAGQVLAASSEWGRTASRCGY
jgi:hypothetical protein